MTLKLIDETMKDCRRRMECQRKMQLFSLATHDWSTAARNKMD